MPQFVLIKKKDDMNYRRVGRSGLLMSEISLGLWHNFGLDDDFVESRSMVLRAFESGITVFDLANNYGPPPGSAEKTFGRIFSAELSAHRNEVVVTTKAGYRMWEGPYGEWGSRKYLVSSCDESLKRLQLDYVDIFYSHRYDPQTPLEETMGALDYIVRSGRALYVGLSNYPADKLREAQSILKSMGTPAIVDQLKYSMLVRDAEKEHFDAHRDLSMGCVSYSPLAQGQLTSRYVAGIPQDSRAAKHSGFLQVDEVEQNRARVLELSRVAEERGESLAKMAIAWQLFDNEQHQRISSVIIGASSTAQLDENLSALNYEPFSEEHLERISSITLGQSFNY